MEKGSETVSRLIGKECHFSLVTFITGVRGGRRHLAIYFSS